MKVLCIGDSNTYGYDPRSYFGSRYPAEVRWTGRLEGHKVINCGMNGLAVPYDSRPFAEMIRAKAPDLAALGYDSRTAVYDISAKAVYLPSGVTLEAHSGLGPLMDTPDHVDRRMVGATPPAIYDLKPREKPFHGVRALCMTPVEGTSALGRVGLLTHNYLLGPRGDSNGCVSIKDYDRFLKAYDNGEFNRLVVVPSLRGAATASQRASTDS